jgi:hypothetical protein
MSALLTIVSHGVDRPPVILKLDVQPPRVPRDSTAILTVSATDPDGTALVYEYKAESGNLVADAKQPDKAHYLPAARGSIADRITVTVKDASGLLSTGSQVVTIEGAVAPAEPGSAIPGGNVLAGAEVPKVGNRPPILNGGGRFYDIGENDMAIEATGMDPDGDVVTFKWDFGNCLLSENVEVYRAEVRLKPEPTCKQGTAILTWTDTHSASASAEWTISR